MIKRLAQLFKGVAYILTFAVIIIFIWERLPFNKDPFEKGSNDLATQPTARSAVQTATKDVKPTPLPTSTDIPIRTVELRQAIKDGIVLFEAVGDGLETLDLLLESLSDEDLKVQIEPGTIFRPGNVTTQSMVVRQGELVDLPASGRVERELDVACANMHKGTPSSSDEFSIDLDISPSDLVDLLELVEFLEEDFRMQQFAIWTITDNPAPNRYVGLGYFGTGNGPNEAELGRIYQLFLAAGIQTGQYRSLAAYPTPTPEPSKTLPPINLEDCLPALDITQAYVGQTVCVYGVVSHTFQGEGYTSLSFSKTSDSLYLLSYDVDLRSHAPQTCIRVVGEVKELRGNPVLVVGFKNTVEACP